MSPQVPDADQVLQDQLLEEQLQVLRALLEPRIRDLERPTFEIRPAVTHEDIEIFLGGRIYPVNSDHFRKVQEAGVERSFVEEVLMKLRSRKPDHLIQTFNYTLRNVYQEVQYVLLEVLETALPADRFDRLADQVDEDLKAALKLEEIPERPSAAALKVSIGLLGAALVNLVVERQSGLTRETDRKHERREPEPERPGKRGDGRGGSPRSRGGAQASGGEGKVPTAG